MSQTPLKESGENSKCVGQGNETLNQLLLFGDKRFRTANVGLETETNSIKTLLNEFKGLYEQRLRSLHLDNTIPTEELHQQKVDFLQSYVNDLTDQNQVLVQTIEDLQKEADSKMSNYGMNRGTSDDTINVSKAEVRPLSLDELVGPPAHTPHRRPRRHPNMDSRRCTLLPPLSSSLLRQKEDMSLFLHIDFPSSLVDITGEVEDLKIQLQTKDIIISDLERELEENLAQNKKTATQLLERNERLVHLQSELSCLQQIQKDNMKEIAGKDICITKLQANIQLLQQEGADTDAQVSKLNVQVRELQEEVRRKEEEWRRREEEQRLTYEKKLEKVEVRQRQEQQKREEERMRCEEEWKREFEEEKRSHRETVKKAAALSLELEVSKKQVERQSRELLKFQQNEKTLLTQGDAKIVSLRTEFSALLERRMEEKEATINQLSDELKKVTQKMKEREEHVRHLDQDVVGLQTTQDSLKRTLAVREKHTQQLVRDSAQLKDSLAAVQSKLLTSESMVRDLSESLDQAKSSLDKERVQKQQMQDQFHHASKEVERLQQELSHLQLSTEKKIQKREIKVCSLVKELTESKTQHSDCQKQLHSKETSLKKLCEEKDELIARMEDRDREFVHLNQTKERLEADLALSHEKLQTSHLEVRSRDQLILQLRAEMKTAEQRHQRTWEQMEALEGKVRRLNQKVRGHQEESHQLSEKVSDIERLKDQKEKEQQELHGQLCISQQQVETSQLRIKKQRSEIEFLHRQLKESKEQLKDASLQAQEQNETIAIVKHKYTAAIEKVHRVQGQVELLEEELRYSKQQLLESQGANHSVKEELAELEQRYKEKIGQWESSQETLDHLTDELQATQNLLQNSQQKLEYHSALMGSLQEQVDTLKQQKLMFECDLRLYQQSHSHSDEEYHSLLKQRQQLQKHCTEQVERLAECEKAILQMKSELERQAQEKASLEKSLVASHHAHLNNCTHLEQEVTHLKKEVTRLELELADTQKVHVTLLRQLEEQLKEARQEAERGNREVDVQKGEVQRLREELQKEKEKKSNALQEQRSLNTYIKQLSQELEELHSKHQLTVEELAARTEEARRMEGCLNKGKLAEEKMRSVVLRLDMEVAEIRKNLQQTVNQQLKAERDKQDAQDQVESLRSELEGTRSDNANLRRESQLVMTNVNRWITEQKASNETLTAQMKAQNKALLIISEEKEHLQEANDTMKLEVKRLKEVADEKERDMERFKAQIREQGSRQDGRTMEKESCVALNISKIEDMQTRLRSNLEAIRMLNQQLNTLSRENKHLRRQLEEERSMRRQVERLCLTPPTSRQCSSVQLPIVARPPPLPTSLPPAPPPPLPTVCWDSVTAEADGILTQTEQSGVDLQRPGGSQALSGALWTKPTAQRSVSASLHDAWSGRTSRDLIK
ncbi:early endosome antigen 1-like [Sphaeramia orbicularis]|uniref:early endosome antigen 1-like n=1 Tax=Sphaeramia orbicularis TaxID=375764 RepID=UPI00117EACC6|nr:early endosome antigen 1-like [Sphaeramia orbicularis]